MEPGRLYHHVMRQVLKKVEGLLIEKDFSEEECQRRLEKLRDEWKRSLFTDLGGAVPGWPNRILSTNDIQDSSILELEEQQNHRQIMDYGPPAAVQDALFQETLVLVR